ncbi:MAG: hypothetical protein J6N52_00815 [Clostridia bacterium]|nr:hypothetical protein [Clostridia bacterium]
MKKNSIVSLLCAATMVATSSISFAAAPGSYDGKAYGSLGYTSDDADGQFNLAVIANGDVKIVGDAMYIQGSVYSNGNIYVGDGEGNKIDGLFISGTESSVDVDEKNGLSHTCEGYIHVNDNGTRDGITYYSVKPEYKGAVKDTDTSFECEYTPYEIPEISNVVEYVNGNQWYPGTVTVSKDTHYNTFEIGGEGLIIDTTNGDVTVVIDRLNTTAGNPFIKVRGSNKANIYINDYAAYGQVTNNVPLTVVNETANVYDWRGYNTSDNYVKEYFDLLNDPNQINLYINNSLNDVILNNGRIAANIYSNADKFTFAGGGKYLGSFNSGASDFAITGGGTFVNGIVCVPNADSRVVDSGTLYGQLHTNTLTNNGAGRIIWKSDAAATAVPQPEKPEEKPDKPVDPDKPVEKPDEPIDEPAPPASGEIFKGSSMYAYIFGDEPDLENLDENGNPEIYMQPDRPVSREEACAMVMRLVDQFVGVDDGMADMVAPAIVNYSDWAAKGLGFISSKGTYDDTGYDISGYNNPTRGEVAKIVAMGLDLNLKKGAIVFNDIAGNPYDTILM